MGVIIPNDCLPCTKNDIQALKKEYRNRHVETAQNNIKSAKKRLLELDTICNDGLACVIDETYTIIKEINTAIKSLTSWQNAIARHKEMLEMKEEYYEDKYINKRKGGK